jgi:hypothetical protein
MSWVDEHWKGVGYGADSGRNCPDFNPNVQSACGQYNARFPDLFMNEEWWGMLAPERGCLAGKPDRLYPRRAFLELSLLWREGGCTPLDALGSEGNPLAPRSYDPVNHPRCGGEIRLERQRRSGQVLATDCELMAFVHTGNPATCPLPPPYMRNLSRSIETELGGFPAQACDVEKGGLFNGRNVSRYPALLAARMKPIGRALWLDDLPFLVRGVCYSPVPVGHDPGYGEPWGDYLTTDYHRIFMRDIELFVRMGANTIRLYTFKTSQRHTEFLNAADESGLVVMGAFEIGTAEHTPLATVEDRERVKDRLARQLRLSRHRALTLWFVGNEMNGPWQGFVCEDHYAERYLTFTDGECQFRNNAEALMRVVDELCQVVHEEGLLCTTPLAGISMPDRYTCYPIEYPGCAPFGPGGWIKYMDPLMQHLDVWSANLYVGRDFREFNFSRIAAYTPRPFLVSEYGIDAYNINVPKCSSEPGLQLCNEDPNPHMIGKEDEGIQAEWVMSLIEGIEKNAITCTHGCESNSVAGGSIMAWVDEWWKGRVIDAVDADERNVQLGPLCPDLLAEMQSPCGYPTPFGFTQPDRFVNEEWFGLFRVKQPCANRVDQIEPREAWYRIKALWKHGGCLLHDLHFNQSNSAIYDPVLYPGCGAAMAATRSTWNFSLVERGREEYPYDCSVLRLVHEKNASACPPVPDHMASVATGISHERANWTGVPDECAFEADAVSLSVPMLSLLAVLTVYSGSRRQLIRLYHLQLRRPIARLLRGGWPTHFAMSLISRIFIMSFAVGLGAAFGAVAGEAVRLALQEPGPATLAVGSLTFVATYVELGAFVGTIMGAGIFLSGMLLRDIIATACVHQKARTKATLRLQRTGSRSRSALSRLLCSAINGDDTQSLYLLHASAVLAERASQQMLVSLYDMHALILPVASHLARIFGFQQRQPRKGSHGGDVYSNVTCQVNHVCCLLVHRVQRHRDLGLDAALRMAIDELHGHVFANFEHWRRHMCLPLPEAAGRTLHGVHGPALLIHVQLYELMLFFLMHGEAANLRHLPEGLCFIFYCARQRLRFDGATRPAEQEPSRLLGRHSISQGAECCHLKHGNYLPHEDFLKSVVTPLYTVLHREIFKRRNEPVDERVMYDDVNEAFWLHEVVQTILGSAEDERDKYDALKVELAKFHGRENTATPQLFVKTYTEKVSFLHVLFTFYRVILLHAVLIHVLLALAFTRGGNGVWRQPWAVSTCSITYALTMIFRQIWGATNTRERRSHRHIARRCATAALLFWLELLCHSSQPVLLVLEIMAPPISALELDLVVFRWTPTLYEAAAYLYLLLGLLTLLRLTPSISELLLGEPFLGARSQLRSDWASLLIYALFWALVLFIKVLFDYSMLIQPIVEPTRKLLQLDLYCWQYNHLYGDCRLDVVDAFVPANNDGPPVGHAYFSANRTYVHTIRWLRMRYFNVVLVALRWMTPLLIMVADTILVYTVVAALWSGLLGNWYRIAEVVEWSDMVRRIEDSVRLLNTRLLADLRKSDPAQPQQQFDRGHAVVSQEAGCQLVEDIGHGRTVEKPSYGTSNSGLRICASPPASPPFYAPAAVVSSLQMKHPPHATLPLPVTLPPRANAGHISTRFQAPTGCWCDGRAEEVPPNAPSRLGGAASQMGDQLLKGSTKHGQIPHPAHERLQGAHMDWMGIPFSIEARSCEWRNFAVVWNEIVCDLRRCDLVSNVEKKELLFYSLGGRQCEVFFGVAEYVIFPTMLTGPVFCTKVLLSSYHDFPSFERTYQQLRDLLCFVAAALGILHSSQLAEVLAASNGIGKLLDEQMRQAWQADVNAPLKLRDALGDLLAGLLTWQAVAADVGESSTSHASVTESAAETLRLLARVFRTLGAALCVDEHELNDHLDVEARAAHFARFMPLACASCSPVHSTAEKLALDLEKKRSQRKSCSRSCKCSNGEASGPASGARGVANDDDHRESGSGRTDAAPEWRPSTTAQKALPSRLRSASRGLGARAASVHAPAPASAYGLQPARSAVDGKRAKLMELEELTPPRLPARTRGAHILSCVHESTGAPEGRSSATSLHKTAPSRVACRVRAQPCLELEPAMASMGVSQGSMRTERSALLWPNSQLQRSPGRGRSESSGCVDEDVSAHACASVQSDVMAHELEARRDSRCTNGLLSSAVPARVIGSRHGDDSETPLSEIPFTETPALLSGPEGGGASDGEAAPSRGLPLQSGLRGRLTGAPLNLTQLDDDDKSRCSALQSLGTKARPARTRRGSNIGLAIAAADDLDARANSCARDFSSRLRRLPRRASVALASTEPHASSVSDALSPPSSPPSPPLAIPPAPLPLARHAYAYTYEQQAPCPSSPRSTGVRASALARCAPQRLVPKCRATSRGLISSPEHAHAHGRAEGSNGSKESMLLPPHDYPVAAAAYGFSLMAHDSHSPNVHADAQHTASVRCPQSVGPPATTLAGGQSRVDGFEISELTVAAEMENTLAVEHLRYFSALRHLAVQLPRHPLLRLLRFLRLEALVRPQAIEETTSRLACTRMKVVLSALVRSLQTSNPGGEPANEQAQRQLVFFCNSLHHRRLIRPPSVCDMRSLCAFTPHYAEDVTYSMDALQVAGDDNASLFTIIKALCPDEWSNLCERIEGLENAKTRERLRVPLKCDQHCKEVVPFCEAAHESAKCRRQGNAACSALAVHPDQLVQSWCSDRSQLLSRTIRGVMRDAHALRVLATLEGVPLDHVDEIVNSKFTYLVTCQLYDKLKNSSVEQDSWKAASIEALQKEFPHNLRVAYVERDDIRGADYSVLMGADTSVKARPDADASAEVQLRTLYMCGCLATRSSARASRRTRTMPSSSRTASTFRHWT